MPAAPKRSPPPIAAPIAAHGLMAPGAPRSHAPSQSGSGSPTRRRSIVGIVRSTSTLTDADSRSPALAVPARSEHAERGRVRLAWIQSEPAGVERVEVERLAPERAASSASETSSRRSMKARPMSTAAPMTMRSASASRSLRRGRRPARPVIAVVRGKSWRWRPEEASVAVDRRRGVAAHLDRADRAEERDSCEVDLGSHAGAEDARAGELALERELE